MEYLLLAYGMIAAVLIGYGASLWRRSQQIRHERESLEAGGK
jgi:hypothetical protein